MNIGNISGRRQSVSMPEEGTSYGGFCSYVSSLGPFPTQNDIAQGESLLFDYLRSNNSKTKLKDLKDELPVQVVNSIYTLRMRAKRMNCELQTLEVLVASLEKPGEAKNISINKLLKKRVKS